MRKPTSSESVRCSIRNQRSVIQQKSIDEQFQQAIAHHGNGRLDRAEKVYRQILDLCPEHLYALFNLGIILHSRDELLEACECYRQVLALDGGNFQVYYYLANGCRDQGMWQEAVCNYEKALAMDPGHADAHYNLGITYYHQDEPDLAVACYEKALSFDPEHAHALYNLGIIHFERGDFDEAINSYEKSLIVRPDDVDTLYNLGVSLSKAGRFEEVANRYQQAIELAPDDAELHNALGKVFKHLHRLEEAAECYRQAIALRPEYGEAYTNLAVVLHVLDDIEAAIECYGKAIECGHEPESADYMLAALTGSNRQSTPRIYIRNLFDSYADHFEKSLTDELGYNTPKLLNEILIDLAGKEALFDRVLDLGCGTGLAGEKFRSVAVELVGVDISGKMLAKAEQKQLYDHLERADLIEFLDQLTESYDLLLAADVLIYLGELEGFFRAVSRRAAMGAYLLFSVEKHVGPGCWQLQRSGRYAHSREHIVELAERYGFTVEVCRESGIRRDRGEWVQGYLFCLRKSLASFQLVSPL